MARGGLGAGLDSLFNNNTNDVQVKTTLRISEIEPNRDQPRKYFDENAINALAESIRVHGVIQPILVRPLSNGNYQIVAGERRWRAARKIGLTEVPVNIRELSDVETAQIAIIENLQRENLNPVEEANGYKELIEKYNMTQEQVAKMVGKSRSAVSNLLRILSLPNEILKMLEDGELTVGHAKALLAFDDPVSMFSIAEKACNGGMTVRQIEALSQKVLYDSGEQKLRIHDGQITNYFEEMEIILTSRLNRKVKVRYADKKGTLTLEFYDKDDLNELAKKLTKN